MVRSFLGRRLRGRNLDEGQEHGTSNSADGAAAMTYGDWFTSTGSARVEGDRLCLM